jgi:hypothetical protein
LCHRKYIFMQSFTPKSAAFVISAPDTILTVSPHLSRLARCVTASPGSIPPESGMLAARRSFSISINRHVAHYKPHQPALPRPAQRRAVPPVMCPHASASFHSASLTTGAAIAAA